MILWADSFDHYGVTGTNLTDGAWAQIFGAPTSDHARTGTYSFGLGANFSAVCRRVFGAAKGTAGVGMALFLPQLPTINDAMTPIQFNDGSNAQQIRIVIESTGAISAYKGGDPVALGTSSELITANGWNHLEAKVVVDDTTGAVEVRLNGVTILNLSGVNTDPNGSGEVSQYQTCNQTNRGADGSWYIDDVIAWDDSGSSNNDFIGDKKVFTDFPDADTADVDWVPSAGSDLFAMIDDPDPDGDGTYDEAENVGDVMGVTYPNVDAAVLAISAIILVHKSRKTDAGTCNVQQSCISGVSNTDGVDRPMTTAYTLYHDVIEVDPATSAPWTPTGANAMAHNLTRTA